MPFFKSTYNILTAPWEDELFNPNWMDSDNLILPESKEWDYSRELQIENVDIWEVLYEASGGIGVYAAWMPMAEFYMITTGIKKQTLNERIIETYYGKNADKKVYNRCLELNIPLQLKERWIEPENMWLFQ
jgi:hypothetical protein